MANVQRKIQFHTIEVSPLDVCLDLWAISMGRDDTDLGIQSQGSLLPNGYANNDTGQSRRDNEIAEATWAMIRSLSGHHRWAIQKSKGICRVWNYPQLDFLKTLADAKIQLEEKLRKNIATRTLF